MAETMTELRERALVLASNTYEPPEMVTQRAKEYLKFLTERDSESDANP